MRVCDSTASTGSSGGQTSIRRKRRRGREDVRVRGRRTSPVLSTTTLQTTPSPPPSNAAELKDTTESVPSDPPAAEPVPQQWPNLNPPRLLHSIPFIPETLEHLPQYSKETFISVWREVTTPLYHCRCRICERAIQTENIANGMATAPITATVENPNANTAPPVVVQSPPVTHSQPVEIRHGQLPHIEVEDGAEQKLEEGDCLTSASVTESTTTTDVVPSHVRKRTLNEVDADVSASEDADAVSSNGADDYGDGVYLQDTVSLYDKHTTIMPPTAKVQLPVTTAMPTTVVNLTPTKKRRISGSYSPAVSPARVRKRSSEELGADDFEYESPCEQREANLATTTRVKTSPEPVNGEKPPAVILRAPPHVS